jgi:hypothetical protein
MEARKMSVKALARESLRASAALGRALGLSPSEIAEIVDTESRSSNQANRAQPSGLRNVSSPARDVVIVPANSAYGFYHRHSAYVCQAWRAFRENVTHLGFYTRGTIQPEIPNILARRNNVEFTEANADRLRATGDPTDAAIADLILRTLGFHDRVRGDFHDVFLLTPPADKRTVVLPHSISHDTKGRGSAWVQRQRYVLLENLRNAPKTTLELEALESGQTPTT